MSNPLPSCMETMSRIADTAWQALLFLMLGMPVAWASGVSISNLTITTFKQIAKLSDADIEKIDANMPFSADQIRDWRDQAKELAK